MINNPFCGQGHPDLSFRADRRVAFHQAKHRRFPTEKAEPGSQGDQRQFFFYQYRIKPNSTVFSLVLIYKKFLFASATVTTVYTSRL